MAGEAYAMNFPHPKFKDACVNCRYFKYHKEIGGDSLNGRVTMTISEERCEHPKNLPIFDSVWGERTRSPKELKELPPGACGTFTDESFDYLGLCMGRWFEESNEARRAREYHDRKRLEAE